jgi:excisionase family DNA binding protein
MSRQFTIEEVAELADRSVTTIKKWIRRKKLRARRSRQYLIGAADVRSFLLEQASLSRAGRRKKVKV